MRYRDCENCGIEIDAREIVTRCTECGENIYEKPKTEIMKATLENFLIKWDGNNPVWKEFIEWLNKTYSNKLNGYSSSAFYGVINNAVNVGLNAQIVDRSIIITLEQWKELLNRKTETMNNFKEKDRVFHIHHGWGTVESINKETSIVVKFDKNIGSNFVDIKLLSFAEYTLQGFTQERPFEPVVGNYYWFWDDGFIESKQVCFGQLTEVFNQIKGKYRLAGLGLFEHISETNPLL